MVSNILCTCRGLIVVGLKGWLKVIDVLYDWKYKVISFLAEAKSFVDVRNSSFPTERVFQKNVMSV